MCAAAQSTDAAIEVMWSLKIDCATATVEVSDLTAQLVHGPSVLLISQRLL